MATLLDGSFGEAIGALISLNSRVGKDMFEGDAVLQL